MTIILVGKSDLQTDLLLSLLRQHIAPDCAVVGEAQLPASIAPETLVILDMAALGLTSGSALLHALSHRGGPRAALMNVDDDLNLSQLAALPGVCGLFARDVNSEQFIRGIRSIREGDYWLPRHVLCAHLDNTRQQHTPAAALSHIKLSPKERKLLSLLSQGCSNEVIANRLAISPHTVKTHFYNLYRKLQVRNRVQAATWVQQHSAALEGAQ